MLASAGDAVAILAPVIGVLATAFLALIAWTFLQVHNRVGKIETHLGRMVTSLVSMVQRVEYLEELHPHPRKHLHLHQGPNGL